MKTIRVFRFTTAITLALLVTLGAVAVSARPASASSGAEQAYARDVVAFINAERAKRGLSPVSWTFSESLRGFMVGNCINHSPGPVQEVIACIYPNAGQPGGAAGGAVHQWMNSDQHNKRLTWSNSTHLVVGVYCDPSTGVAHVAAQPDGGFVERTPFRPSSTNYLAGAQCPGPKPVVTAPPATQPPATHPPATAPAPQPTLPKSTPPGATPGGAVSGSASQPQTRVGTSAAPKQGSAAAPVSGTEKTASGTPRRGKAGLVTPSSAKLRDPDPITRPRDPVEERATGVAPSSANTGKGVPSGPSAKTDDSSSFPGWLVASGLAVTVCGAGLLVARRHRPSIFRP